MPPTSSLHPINLATSVPGHRALMESREPHACRPLMVETGDGLNVRKSSSIEALRQRAKEHSNGARVLDSPPGKVAAVSPIVADPERETSSC
nr:hypothetical protein BaRGS_030024 [Batillaria attramentaria]